jgi:septal ring factor EnvC (AmiA/AmiB activator)
VRLPVESSARLARRVMNESDELTAFQLQKVRQEIEKLDAETRLLKRVWCLQPPYIAAILPIIAVCVTAWIAYSNSDFKREAETAKSEIAQLRPTADALRQQVMKLQQEETSLKAERNRLTAEVSTLQPKATGLQKQILAFSDHISTWRSQLVDINTRLESVTPHVVTGPIFPPPTAEPERKRLQEIIDSMFSTLGGDRLRQRPGTPHRARG